MIDERLEELAALYALDLLEGAERAQFEVALARDPALRAAVERFRSASDALARSAETTPPPALKARVLASIAGAPATTALPDNVIRPSAFRIGRAAPWAIAAGFALLAGWTGQRFMATRTELAHMRQQHALADVALQAVRQQLEAERIVTRRQAQDLDQQLNAAQTQLAQARTQLQATTAQLAAANNQSADRGRQVASLQDELAGLRTVVADREQQVAALRGRVDALAGASAEIGRQLGEAKDRIAKLTDEMKLQRDIADFKITLLASLAQDQPQARAVAVWDPTLQQGVLKVENLPALAPNQDYQLWVVDPAYKDPVDGGVFTVSPESGASSVSFTPKQPVKAVAAFAITRERKGGVPKSAGPMLLLGK